MPSPAEYRSALRSRPPGGNGPRSANAAEGPRKPRGRQWKDLTPEEKQRKLDYQKEFKRQQRFLNPSDSTARLPLQPLIDLGYSQRELAERLGIAHAGNNAIGDPRGITINTAERIAQALGKHPSEIWGEDYYADIDINEEGERRRAEGIPPPSVPGVPPEGRTTPLQQTQAPMLPQLPGPNTLASSADLPSEGERPPFPPDWDVNNPADRRRHFEQVYESLLDNLVGSFAGPEGVPPAEVLPRVGPGSAWSQGRNVVRPADAGLPPWWSDDGTTNERRAWLVEHPEYQIAPDFTDETDYPVDIPYEDEDPSGGNFGWRKTYFGGDEYDRYWAGPQAGVGKADQAAVQGEQQSRKFVPPSSLNAGPDMPMNTQMSRGLDDDPRPWWMRLLESYNGQPGAAMGIDPSQVMPPDDPGSVTVLPPNPPRPPFDQDDPTTWNTQMSSVEEPDEPLIPSWMMPDDLTHFWESYPAPEEPGAIDPRHPAFGGGMGAGVGGGGGEPPTVYVPGDFPPEPPPVPPWTGPENQWVWWHGTNDRFRVQHELGEEFRQRAEDGTLPMPGEGGLSAMSPSPARRDLGGFTPAPRRRDLGGYRSARPLAPLGGFGYRRNLPPMGGYQGARQLPAATAFTQRALDDKDRSPFDGMLENLERNSGKIAAGAAIGLGAIASGIGRTLSPFGG